MFRNRWIHHAKAGSIAACLLLVSGAAAGLLWMNQRGFEGEWGERIAEELSHRGIHADFDTVRFSPMRGIIARRVVFFTDASRQEVFAHIPRLRFEVDRAKALRGELLIRRVIIHDAHLTVPIKSDRSEKLTITGLSGRASLDRQNRLVLEGARGTLGGMVFHLEVQLDEFELDQISKPPEPGEMKRRDEFVSGVLGELAHWSFPASMPPELSFRITGSAKRPASIRSAFSIAASEVSRHDYTMEAVQLTGGLRGRTLTVDRLRFSEGSGKLSLRAGYDLEEKTGHFQATSSIKITDLLRKALDDHTLDDIISPHAPKIEARGQFSLAGAKLQLGVIGSVSLDRFRFLGIPLRGLTTQFSWQDGDIYLRELSVNHEGGELTGQILLKADTILYQAKSSLPLSAYRAFIKPQSGLEKALGRSLFPSQSRVLVEARGDIPRSNLGEWKASGVATLQNFSYQDIPITRATASFEMDELDSIFTDLEIEFDYSAYPLRLKHGGPASGLVQAERVHYNPGAKLVHLTSLRGTAWPAPILRLFTPSTADYLERTYRFRAPPEFHATGVIDTRKPATRTDVTTLVRTFGFSDYDFLDQTLQLTELSAKVRTRPTLHDIDDLRFRTFGGIGWGSLNVETRANGTKTVSGNLNVNGIEMTELGKKYEFKNPVPGSVTAQAAFRADATKTPRDGFEWVTRGKANFGESIYNQVPIARASTEFEITRHHSTYSNLAIEFDYRDYVLRRQHGGPSTAIVQTDKLEFDKLTELVQISNLRGTAWPAPLLRLVSPPSAEHLEKTYRFRSPPGFRTSGTVDTRQPATRTDLLTSLGTQGITDYDFLDRTLQLTGVSGRIRTRPSRHDISELVFRTLGGSGAGTITVDERPGRGTLVRGGIKWNDLRLAEIGKKYDFDKTPKGTITGRIDFTNLSGEPRGFNGKGVIGLRDGQLFHVPVFGPLSLLLGGVLGKEFSHEQASDASATFVIKNAVVHTNDFLTSTPSTVFTGEGRIDLPSKHLDMTIRMNARGLLGLITLPLKPFNGLFQFRGQGPIKDPSWSASPFTQPARGEDDPIFRQPPRAQVVPER